MAIEQITNLTNTEKARKYLYAVNEITKTWRDVAFFLTNVKRVAGRMTNGGRSAIIPLETAPTGSFRFSLPSESPAESGTAKYDEATIDYTTFSVSTEYDWHAKLAGQTDKQSFISLKTKCIADSAEIMGNRWSHALLCPKTNAMARLKTDLGGNRWQLYTETESGANGTTGARYLFKNGYASASVNTTGYDAELAFDGLTTTVDRLNDQAVFSGTGLTSLAADAYIYWGTKARTSKGRGLTGLPEIIDDGTNYAVFEGRNRTTAGNEDWQAGLSTGFGTGNIELEMINQSIDLEKRLPGAYTDVVFYGLKAQRMHFQQMAVNRQAMIPVSGISGGPTFFGGFKALPVSYGDRTIAAMASVEFPDDRMYGINWEGIALAMLTEPVWMDEGEGIWHHIDDTYRWKAHLSGVGQVVSKNPALHWATLGITP